MLLSLQVSYLSESITICLTVWPAALTGGLLVVWVVDYHIGPNIGPVEWNIMTRGWILPRGCSLGIAPGECQCQFSCTLSSKHLSDVRWTVTFTADYSLFWTNGSSPRASTLVLFLIVGSARVYHSLSWFLVAWCCSICCSSCCSTGPSTTWRRVDI